MGADMLSRWLLTARVIAMALVPASGRIGHATGKFSAPANEGGFMPLAPKALDAHMGNLRVILDDRQQLRLLLKGCRSIAAPFLLFRLKRQGFSRCRAEAASEGIYLSADG
jgi:hypothetical protein